MTRGHHRRQHRPALPHCRMRFVAELFATQKNGIEIPRRTYNSKPPRSDKCFFARKLGTHQNLQRRGHPTLTSLSTLPAPRAFTGGPSVLRTGKICAYQTCMKWPSRCFEEIARMFYSVLAVVWIWRTRRFRRPNSHGPL